MEHLFNIILIALFCTGWVTILGKGMILGKLGERINKLPKWIGKPLGGCVPCAASIVGSVAYILLIVLKSPLAYYVVYIVASVIVNQMLWFFTKYLILKTKEQEALLEIRNKQLEALNRSTLAINSRLKTSINSTITDGKDKLAKTRNEDNN